MEAINSIMIALPLAAGVIALVFAAIMAMRVVGAEAGNERMAEIGDAIRTGASAFLRREYLALLPSGGSCDGRAGCLGLHPFHP